MDSRKRHLKKVAKDREAGLYDLLTTQEERGRKQQEEEQDEST